MIKCIESIVPLSTSKRIVVWSHPKMHYNVSYQQRYCDQWRDCGGSFNIPTKSQALSVAIMYKQQKEQFLFVQ